MAQERVNYYTGQRLDADDFRAEQRYQDRIRRLLNHGLFTPGVVEGLEVSRIMAGATLAPRTVRVSPGTALDALGRLIVLDEQHDVAVPNQPPLSGTNYYYLVLRYAEEPLPGRADECSAPDTAPVTRIREKHALEWSEVIPFPRPADPEDSIEQGVVLALVELKNVECTIAKIDPEARRSSYPRNVSRVQAVAYEGEKDIAEGNSKKLYFHIRGGPPSAVVLYLRGDRFSSTFYTEAASHTHASKTAIGSTDVATQNHQHLLTQHSHTISEQVPDPPQGTHQHGLWMQGLTRYNHPERAIPTWTPPSPGYQMYGYSGNLGDNPGRWEDYVEPAGGHSHSLALTSDGDTSTGGLVSTPAALSHTHSFTATVDAVGSTGYSLRGGAAYTVITDVRVALDGKDITPQLVRALPTTWTTLGGTLGGDENHPFNKEGTGPLDLVQLGLSLGPGEHWLEFSAAGVPDGQPPVGGKIIYNLYIE